MAKEIVYPVQIYPPGGTGAVTYKEAYYGLDSPILVLKAQMSGAVAFKVTTDSIKADEQPYNSVCLPTPRKEVAFSYSKQDSFTQEIGNYFYETTVTITNTGSTGIKGLTGDSAYVEPRVIKLWKTIQHGQFSCQSNFTTDDKKLNETIRVFEFEITEDKESTTTSTMPDPSTTTSDEGSTTTSTMPDTSATTFEEGSTTTSAVTDNNAP